MSSFARDILDFWFGPKPHSSREEWFRKDPAFDAAIRTRFAAAIDAAIEGGPRDDGGDAQEALARIVLLDQFTRNAWRDTPRAFAGDALALATAIAVVDGGHDGGFDRYERVFLCLPFEHAEDPAMQRRSIALFTRLAEDTGEPGQLEWAARHAAIIRRFGRYPHRNAILGRTSTPEEIAFLQEPGSRF